MLRSLLDVHAFSVLSCGVLVSVLCRVAATATANKTSGDGLARRAYGNNYSWMSSTIRLYADRTTGLPSAVSSKSSSKLLQSVSTYSRFTVFTARNVSVNRCTCATNTDRTSGLTSSKNNNWPSKRKIMRLQKTHYSTRRVCLCMTLGLGRFRFYNLPHQDTTSRLREM